jgi:hypothetical protein
MVHSNTGEFSLTGAHVNISTDEYGKVLRYYRAVNVTLDSSYYVTTMIISAVVLTRTYALE